MSKGRKVGYRKLLSGLNERMADKKVDRAVAAYASMIAADGLFDQAFYANHSPDVIDAGLDPLWHFFRYGHLEGRWPSPRFDPAFYREAHLGGDRSINPLVHYLREGRDKGLATSPAHGSDMQNASGRRLPSPSLTVEDAITEDFRAFCTATGVFDEAFYTLQYQDLAQSGLPAFEHFMTYGWKDGRDPSRVFSMAWYWTTHLNGDRRINPLVHYHEHGVYMGLSTKAGVAETADIGALRGLSQHGRFVYAEAPEVTIAIINYNGLEHLADLTASLAALDYPSYSVMIVDNGSNDGSVAWLHKNAPFVQVIELPDNIGFSDAANLALDLAPTQLVAFLNNDMVVDRMWLRGLVDRLKASPQHAAATSKMLFFKPFVTLTIEADAPFILKTEELLAGHAYKKLFVEHGQPHDDLIVSDDENRLSVKLPYEPSCRIALAPYPTGDTVDGFVPRLRVSVAGVHVHDSQGATEIFLDPDRFAGAAQWVVNNAGSHETSRDIVGDRGFASYDIGQYDMPETVDYLCGGSFLINRLALQGKPLFMGDLFAYFEDTELSVRLRQAGYLIAYAPDSVGYHKHASTSQEKSVFFQRRVERNYSAFYARKCGLPRATTQIAHTLSRLNHLSGFYAGNPDSTAREKELSKVYPDVMAELRAMQAALVQGTEFLGSHRTLRIGVYNSYWSTAGGGELHALNIANYLSRFGIVDLISEKDFDLDALLTRFELPRGRFRKVLVFPLSPADTAAYDVFVNSTYGSNLPSRARHSFYIVSFPRPGATEEMLTSYTFLPNSLYTNHWCKEFWGERPTALVYPLVRDVAENAARIKKQKLILHVGRFFPDGHSKMQHEIVRSFKDLVKQNPAYADWKLVCVGGLDTDRPDCMAYFEHVSALAYGANVELLPNAGFDQLNQLYRDAALYWHATGFAAKAPENPYSYEHFGISLVEAMSAHCVPVVLGVGGPSEIVDDPSFGSVFTTRAEWIDHSLRWMAMFDEDPESFAKAGKTAAIASRRYQKESFAERAKHVFARVAEDDAQISRTRSDQEFTSDRYWRFVPEQNT